MKKIISTLAIAAALNVQAQCCYTDNYSATTGWTFNGVETSISSGTFNFLSTPDDGYNYATHAIGCTLSDRWTADIDFIYSARGLTGVGHILLGVTAGTLNAINGPGAGFPISNEDAMAMYINCPNNGAQSTDSIFGNSKKGTTLGTPSRGIYVALNTQYYLRMEKLNSTSGRISVFSDAGRTTHITGSPKTFTFSSLADPSGLTTVQSGSIPQFPLTKQLSAKLDNLHICDPPPCCDTVLYSSSSGWTLNGSDIAIASGVFQFNTTPCGAYNYAVDSLPCTISDSAWVSNIDFEYTGRGLYGVAHTILGVQAGTQDTWNTGAIGSTSPSNQNAIFTYINCPVNGAQTTDSIFANSKSGTTSGIPSRGIYINTSTQYYLRLERISPTQGKISVFTDAGRTMHQPGSPQTFAISNVTGSQVTGLHVIEHGCIPQGFSGRTLTGTIDNFNICGYAEPYRMADPSTLGIADKKSVDGISIYPNPNNGTFTIETTGGEKQNTVMLYDINGKLVLTQTITGKTSIDASNLNAGIYNLSLISNGAISNKRIIITK